MILLLMELRILLKQCTLIKNSAMGIIEAITKDHSALNLDASEI